MTDSIRYTLRAMAENYSNGHSWDFLDGEACIKAANEIATLDRKLNACEKELTEVSVAIGSVRWMDPPDGCSIGLGEQVARMRADLEIAETALEKLTHLYEGEYDPDFIKRPDWLTAALDRAGK